MSKLHEGQVEGKHENLALLLEQYGISDFTFAPINAGIENSSFRIESGGKAYVLRVYRHQKKPETEIELEVSFVRWLKKNGIPVPNINMTTSGAAYATAVIEGREHHSILMDFIEGTNVTPNPSKELFAELATYQAQMHLLGIEFATSSNSEKKPWSELRDGLAGKIKDPTLYPEDIQAFIERAKKYSHLLSAELPYGYNHLDIDFDGNVLTKDGHVAAIIDFDDLQYSPVVACLGFTLRQILDDKGEQTMREYLHAYEQVRPVSASEYEALPYIMFFRNYAIGITHLVVNKNMLESNIDHILRLEKEIPTLKFPTTSSERTCRQAGLTLAAGTEVRPSHVRKTVSNGTLTSMTILLGIVALLGLWSIWGYFSSRVEQAEYSVISNAEGYEVREYAPHIEAQTTVDGSYDEALSKGFRIIAGYIFGGNTTKERIAMTAPVREQKQSSERIAMTAPVVARTQGDARVVAFVMPKSYTLASLPTPKDSRVALVEVPAKKMAVLRFTWFRTSDRITTMENQLRAALSRDEVEMVGSPSYAGYNAPWTPPWMTRNEVMIEIR